MAIRNVEATLATIVHKHSRAGVESVQRRHRLAADLAFDSLALLMMVTDLEDAFGVEFPLEGIDELQDLKFGDLVRLVRARIESGAPVLAGLGAE